MTAFTLRHVAWPVLRALRSAILAGERTLNALPDPHPLDPLGNALTILAALTLGALILAACAVVRAILWLTAPLRR